MIVKRHLEEQSKELSDLRNLIKEQELKLRLKKNDFDKVHGLELKKDALSHKEKTESLYRQKLEEEKRKMMKGKMSEFEDMIGENKQLKDEVGKLKIQINKLNK